jgi:hypothetical protein
MGSNGTCIEQSIPSCESARHGEIPCRYIATQPTPSMNGSRASGRSASHLSLTTFRRPGADGRYRATQRSAGPRPATGGFVFVDSGALGLGARPSKSSLDGKQRSQMPPRMWFRWSSSCVEHTRRSGTASAQLVTATFAVTVTQGLLNSSLYKQLARTLTRSSQHQGCRNEQQTTRTGYPAEDIRQE